LPYLAAPAGACRCRSIACKSPANHLPIACRFPVVFLGHYIDTAQLVPGLGGNSAGPCSASMNFYLSYFIGIPCRFRIYFAMRCRFSLANPNLKSLEIDIGSC
jgi:hypothetical protein